MRCGAVSDSVHKENYIIDIDLYVNRRQIDLTCRAPKRKKRLYLLNKRLAFGVFDIFNDSMLHS